MCENCDWEGALELAQQLAEEGSDYADSVAEWIEQHEHVTDGQYDALKRAEDVFGGED